ncbi:methyltransferase domain-containing protein [Candidatus Woesearchaeota archaeon]|nr:methyltransferase domain-containing protein [Candidatus Woesearchaeota archaeon]
MDYYNSISKGYDELHEAEQTKKLELISKKIDIYSNETLLDVGCGSGISTRFWKCRRTGVDPSEELIAVARQNDRKGKYLVGMAEKLPFDDNSFSIVQSLTAIHNFEDIKKGLQEMKRVGNEKYIFSVLKRSQHFDRIKLLIIQMFDVNSILQEEKDTIFLCGFQRTVPF